MVRHSRVPLNRPAKVLEGMAHTPLSMSIVGGGSISCPTDANCEKGFRRGVRTS